jgi:hypothetical protein
MTWHMGLAVTELRCPLRHHMVTVYRDGADGSLVAVSGAVYGDTPRDVRAGPAAGHTKWTRASCGAPHGNGGAVSYCGARVGRGFTRRVNRPDSAPGAPGTSSPGQEAHRHARIRRGPGRWPPHP